MTVQRSVTDRLRALESAAVRFRMGEVTDTTPLTVTLGGSSTAYTDVMCIAANGPKTGDTVACLVFGNDLLVLGTLTGAPKRTVSGIVESTGALLEGTGFTPSTTGTGLYTITFSTAFSDIPSLTVTPFTGGARFWGITAHSASAVSVRIADAANTPTDTRFHFVAEGPA